MRATVPQFIDYEAKVVGPLTFRQFVYVGMAGAACFVIYFSAPFSVFLLSCFVLGGGALALAFFKVGGMSLPSMLANFLKFSISPKVYLWRKKEEALMIYKKQVGKKKEERKEELPLKIAASSQLKRLRTQIEIKTK